MKNNFSRIMGEKRLRISKVSEETKISRTTLTNLYYEKNENVHLSTLVTLCDYLEVPLNEIVEHTPEVLQGMQ